MAAHPLRAARPELRGRWEPQKPEHLFEALAASLGQAGKNAAVVVDGNLPTEDVVAALLLARQVVGTDRASIYLPESDAAMVKGIQPGTPILSLQDVAGCDVFLAVGDVFATHPVVSRHVLDARAARKARLFGLDCLPNRVNGFAEQFLRVRPGGEAAALAALCGLLGRDIPAGNTWAEGRSPAALASLAGLSESELRPVADALSKGKQAAVLLDPVPGRMTNVTAAASIASALCGAPGLRLMPMFCCGNAVGAARAAASLGAAPLRTTLQAALDGRAEILLSIGVDVLRALPREDASVLHDRVATLVVASAFRNASTEHADVVIPLAMWFEQSGSVLDPAGTRLDLEPLAPAPAGALNVRELCARLAAGLGASPTRLEAPTAAPFVGSPASAIEVEEAPSAGLRLVARADAVDFDTGSVSRTLSWPGYLEPVPDLYMNAADARSRGLASRSSVLVRANGREARAQVRIANDLPSGVAELSAAFAETRPLFRCRVDSAQCAELAWSDAEVTLEGQP
jgi:anaerobic selenocysteine-containing dehydrogenase